MDRDELINQIQDYDILIQSFVEDDEPKSLEELNKLPYAELKEWLEVRKAVLQFLIRTEDDGSGNFLS